MMFNRRLPPFKKTTNKSKLSSGSEIKMKPPARIQTSGTSREQRTSSVCSGGLRKQLVPQSFSCQKRKKKKKKELLAAMQQQTGAALTDQWSGAAVGGV